MEIPSHFYVEMGQSDPISYVRTWQDNLSSHYNHKHKYTLKSYNQEVIYGIYSFVCHIYNNYDQ